MTIILLNDIELIFSSILIQLISMLPAFLGVWLLFWFIRSLIFRD